MPRRRNRAAPMSAARAGGNLLHQNASGAKKTAAEQISIGVFRPRISARTLRNCAVPRMAGAANPCQGPEMLTSNLAGLPPLDASPAGQQILQVKQVFQFHIATQKKTITGSRNPSAGIHRRGGVHRKRDRPNPQVGFRWLGVFSSFVLWRPALPARDHRGCRETMVRATRANGIVPRATSSFPAFPHSTRGAHWSLRRYRSITSQTVWRGGDPSTRPAGRARRASLYRLLDAARGVELGIQQSTRGQIGGQLLFRLTQQSHHRGQRHLLSLKCQIVIGPFVRRDTSLACGAFPRLPAIRTAGRQVCW